MATETLDREADDGPKAVLEYESGETDAIVLDDSGDWATVKVYRNGQCVWKGDVQDATRNIVDGRDMGLPVGEEADA